MAEPRRRLSLAGARAWPAWRSWLWGVRPGDVGLLAGIRRSGNAYLRFLLANDDEQVASPARSPLTYADMSQRLGQTPGWCEITPDLRRPQPLAAVMPVVQSEPSDLPAAGGAPHLFGR